MLADDPALLRVSLSALLNTEPGMRVVGAAENGAEAVDLAAALRPDVVLMDVRMPGVNGIDATRKITEDSSVRVIMPAIRRESRIHATSIGTMSD
ncbi:response regulator transcription factor [Streptosporangium canum]|uniref:response regulator n=1 Tax=Streptosporangium canum TaxID=324952 RepID=UPI00367DC3B2